MAEHELLQITIADGNCTARAKQDIAKGATGFRQRKLSFSSAIQIVEY